MGDPDPTDSLSPGHTADRDPGERVRAGIVQGITAVVGVGAALLGLCLATVAAFELARGGDGTLALEAYVGLIVLGLVLAYWGTRMGWQPLGLPTPGWPSFALRPSRRGLISTPKPASAPTDADRERLVLRHVEKQQGRVTSLEVAGRCNLTADEAKTLLDGMVLRKAARLHVSESGILVYVFPRFLPGSGRARRRRRG